MESKERWIVRGGRAQPIVEKYGMAPFIARILAGRLNGKSVEEFLNREGSIFDPSLLLDMEKAVEILLDAIKKREKICIVGDYDVDGMTATAILYLGIKRIDPGCDLICRIPERITDGYGFSKGIAEELLQEGVQLALTCDNGVREFETATYLKENQVRLIITDHHAIATDEEGEDILPEADAVVNPHRKGDGSLEKNICGAFVAYQFIRSLCMDQGIDPETDSVLLKLKGYAAMGTVCDVMPLMGENRKIVYQGLKILNEAPPCGIAAMMKVAALKKISSYGVAFTLGPMINAGGRLGSQNRFLDILISDSQALCKNLAQELHVLNKNRQQMTERGIREGIEQAKQYEADKVKIIYLPDLHESIAGLVAGKLREHLNAPVFVMTRGMDGVKGSGRSIEAYSMFEEMDLCSDLFEKYGGHAMAAGFSLKTQPGHEEESVQAMRDRLNASCRLNEEDMLPIIYIDSTMDPGRISLNLVHELEMIEPFGTGNPKPLLAFKHVELTGLKTFGKEGKYLSMNFRSESGYFRAISFDRLQMERYLMDIVGEEELERLINGGRVVSPVYIDLIYTAETDTYLGEENVSIRIKSMRRSQA